MAQSARASNARTPSTLSSAVIAQAGMSDSVRRRQVRLALVICGLP
jgi:hypothetical protein